MEPPYTHRPITSHYLSYRTVDLNRQAAVHQNIYRFVSQPKEAQEQTNTKS
jgi:hypothetical protein